MHAQTPWYASFTETFNGLKQVPRQLYEKLHQALFHFGFVSSKCDHYLFIYSHQRIIMYLCRWHFNHMFIFQPTSWTRNQTLSQVFLEEAGKTRIFHEVKYQCLETSNSVSMVHMFSMIFIVIGPLLVPYNMWH